MQIFSKVKAILAKPYVKPVLSVLVVLVIAIVIKNAQSAKVEVAEETTHSLVSVTSAANFVSSDSLSLIGTVRAFTEAKITAEAGGRVTSVNTKLGSTVSAGQVIATIENASEQASLLQAEGAYEAAKASAAQSNIGVAQADNNFNSALNAATAANRSAYSTVNTIVLETVDKFYSNAVSGVIGLRVSGNTAFLNSERISLRTTLQNWQTSSQVTLTESDILERLDESIANTKKVQSLVENFLLITSKAKNDEVLDGSQLTSYNASLQSAQVSLNATLSSLINSKTTYLSALESRKQAQIGGTSAETSLADAQLKQALGNLRAAQANYAKTILRSPITGTVNSLDIKAGDYISAFTQAAVVANNNALEIVSYVGDKERDTLAVGDVVVIDGSFEGTITQISPAVDAATRKTEIRIAAENQNIKNGDTVKISRKQNPDTPTVVTEIRVPLTAVKFEIEDGFVFTVEDGMLKSHAVTLGRVNANSVVITSGLDADQEFVIDARGLIDGQKVEVKK